MIDSFQSRYNFITIILIAVTIVYSITAYFSVGYYHPDEHFQIIEFANYIDGKIPGEYLSWEFNDQIRPTLQPWIAYYLFQFFEFFGANDPHIKMFLIRLLTAGIAIHAIHTFSKSCESEMSPQVWKVFYVLGFFIWYVPALSVRFSSENWSGLAFIYCLSIIMNGHRDKKSYINIGLFLGLAFLFRFQIALAGIGLVLWLIFIRKEHIRMLIVLGLSATIVIALGCILDCIFYDSMVFTPLRYYDGQLLQGKAAGYGIAPWFYYLERIKEDAIPILGWIIISASVFMIISKPKSIVVWILVPFIFIHSVIDHKELRFLFPLIFYSSYIIISPIDYLSSLSRNYKSQIIKSFGIIILAINLLPLVILSTKPMRFGGVSIIEEINNSFHKEHIRIYYLNQSNPYAPFGSPLIFYFEKNSRQVNIGTETLHDIYANDDLYYKVLVVSISDLENWRVKRFIKRFNMVEVKRSYPYAYESALKEYGYCMDCSFVLFEMRDN